MLDDNLKYPFIVLDRTWHLMRSRRLIEMSLLKKVDVHLNRALNKIYEINKITSVLLMYIICLRLLFHIYHYPVCYDTANFRHSVDVLVLFLFCRKL